MRTLVIDNYDSFTWNLAQYIAEVNGEEPRVIRNDEYSWEELQQLGPFDSIVISPGPGSVENDADFNVSRQVIAQSPVPLLGVCLGHQGIAHSYGGAIRHAPEPMHGRRSTVWHNADPLFRGIPTPLQVVRYHSLVAASPLPHSLCAIAFAEDGLIMALRHRERPLWGVQFHPESILTEYGHQLMRNFRDLSHALAGRVFPVAAPPAPVPAAVPPPAPLRQVLWREVATPLAGEDLFVGLYGEEPRAYWLDSALVIDGLSRFSFLGAVPDDPSALRQCRIVPGEPESMAAAELLLSGLDGELAGAAVGGEDLPFEFHGGWIGYFGYEMKAVCGAAARRPGRYPDAVWLRAERFVAVDHRQQRVFLVAAAAPEERAAATAWLEETARRIAALAPAPGVICGESTQALRLEWDQTPEDYVASIAECKRAIVDGESYEICLTNQLTVRRDVDGLALYRILRRTNPAPFAAYLRLGELQIVSASPERFLKVDAAGTVETKPIKGTCRRDPDPVRDAQLAEELRCSEKNRAENLMIVDLLRNDLGRVAECGSVKVPRLMYVESYATVHQLLSTVTAKLRREHSLIDLVRAAFPGGSITGAPKIRTMHLIDALERSARGVYCGSIGYLGYNRVADLNIAIRTLVVEPGQVSLGVGGAITHLSDAADEFGEIVLKAKALVRALSLCVHGKDIDYLSQFVARLEQGEAECIAG
jgi:para-aminobenzoate synthetase